MDLLDAGALFQPELRLAERAADIAVGLEIADLQILALEEIRNGAENIGKAPVLIQALGDIFRKRAKNDPKDQQHDDHDHDRAARKNIDDVENRRYRQ